MNWRGRDFTIAKLGNLTYKKANRIQGGGMPEAKSISEPIAVEFVDRWLYTHNGLRVVGQLRADGGVKVSSLASERERAAAISSALKERRGG